MSAAPSLVWSYSFLNELENCNHKAYRKYILRDLPFVQTEAMRWGDTVHKAFEARLTTGKPLPSEMDHYERFAAALDGRPAHAELRLGIRWDGSSCGFHDTGVWGRTKIDWVQIDGTRAVIMDWKTGKKREDSFELEINALLLQAKYTQVTSIVGHYVWLADNAIGKAHDLSDTFSTYNSVQKMMAHTEQAQKMNHWPKRENPLCGWCPVHDCEFNRDKERKK